MSNSLWHCTNCRKQMNNLRTTTYMFATFYYVNMFYFRPQMIRTFLLILISKSLHSLPWMACVLQNVVYMDQRGGADCYIFSSEHHFVRISFLQQWRSSRHWTPQQEFQPSARHPEKKPRQGKIPRRLPLCYPASIRANFPAKLVQMSCCECRSCR